MYLYLSCVYLSHARSRPEAALPAGTWTGMVAKPQDFKFDVDDEGNVAVQPVAVADEGPEWPNVVQLAIGAAAVGALLLLFQGAWVASPLLAAALALHYAQSNLNVWRCAVLLVLAYAGKVGGRVAGWAYAG